MSNTTSTSTSASITVTTGTNQTTTSTATSIANATSTTVGQNENTKWNPYTDFYSFLNFGLFKDGGDCYGFSSTSIIYFEHYALGDQTAPFYPEPTSSTAALPGSTGKYCLSGICLAPSDTLSQSTFPIYIHQTYGWYYDASNALAQPDEQTSIQLLIKSIDEGLPILMVLGPSEGHAIVAWGYSRNPDGSMTINVSDPNFGNTPRLAHYSNGQFSYAGRGGNDLCVAGILCYTWTEFSVVSPATLQWGWLGLGDDNSGQWHSIVNATNGYYKYVFASVPIAILELPSAGTTSSTTSPGPAYLGQASFGAPGDSLSFNSTIPGVVGFEEGGIQVYGIPSGVPFVIKDPGLTSSRIVVVIPQNETSVVGYELNSESTTSLGLEVTPSEASLGISASTNASLSVSFFSTGLHSYSVFNATSIPVTTAQTATFGIPNWEELNDSQLSPSLQIFQQGSTSPVATYTLTNGQNGLPAPAGSANNLLPVVALSATLAIGVALIFLYSRRKSRSESHPGRLGPIWMKYQQINARIPYVLPIYEPHPSSVFG